MEYNDYFYDNELEQRVVDSRRVVFVDESNPVLKHLHSDYCNYSYAGNKYMMCTVDYFKNLVSRSIIKQVIPIVEWVEHFDDKTECHLLEIILDYNEQHDYIMLTVDAVGFPKVSIPEDMYKLRGAYNPVAYDYYKKKGGDK